MKNTYGTKSVVSVLSAGMQRLHLAGCLVTRALKSIVMQTESAIRRKVENGKTMCSECAIKYRRWGREWHSRKSRHFKETGQCQWCDSMAIPGKNYCQKHYYDLCERIAKGRKSQKDKAVCKRMNNVFWMEYKKEGV